MPKAIAINVAANTSLPGFRGPIYPDGSFVYVPIPEREPTDGDVPTYGELGVLDELPFAVDESLSDRRVHVDPEFAGHLGRDRYTYGDEHGVKAGPLSTLEPGDWLLFYATLSTVDPGGLDADGGRSDGADEERDGGDTDGDDPDEWHGERVDWRPPEWGAYLIGEFRVREVVTGEEYAGADSETHAWTATNAHVQRETVDAAVFVRGGERSRLFDRAVPLSVPSGGSEANALVTDLSADSGRGPWWRRPLRYDETATATLRDRLASDPDDWLG
ncbi:hypothetical protein RYH80_13640 [Halobaculum sp. MBLA0147]|uniref:Nmad3 family putative nucleotide modification protein n=1 Tax=Halobaculum sp. MBLA0147 TaxID=3079934 RepID=UPI00352546C8